MVFPQHIVIRPEEHTLSIMRGIITQRTFPITTGGVDSPTSRGEFGVLNKIENVESYHGYTFPLWLGAYEVGEYENGIHSVKGENPWEQCIGNSNCTPGSIILSDKDMEYLYDRVEVGTLIYIE